MTYDTEPPLTNIDLIEEWELSLSQLCRACQLPAEQVFALVEEGIVEPHGDQPGQWRFHSVAITRIKRARRLEHDLGVNLAGVALALDLLEEIEQLKRQLRRLEASRSMS